MIRKPEFDSFGSPNDPKIWISGVYLLHTYEVAPMSLVIKFQVNPAETFQVNTKTYILGAKTGL